MKQVRIYVDFSYESRYKKYIWIFYMAYKDCVMKKSGYARYYGKDGALLEALYRAFERINQPCEVTIYSKADLGFKNPKNSNHKGLITDILRIVNNNSHIIKFEIDKEFREPFMWEQLYGKVRTDSKVEDTCKKENKKEKLNPNDIFKIENNSNLVEKQYKKDNSDKIEDEDAKAQLQKELDDLMNDRDGAWLPGSGGY